MKAYFGDEAERRIIQARSESICEGVIKLLGEATDLPWAGQFFIGSIFDRYPGIWRAAAIASKNLRMTDEQAAVMVLYYCTFVRVKQVLGDGGPANFHSLPDDQKREFEILHTVLCSLDERFADLRSRSGGEMFSSAVLELLGNRSAVA